MWLKMIKPGIGGRATLGLLGTAALTIYVPISKAFLGFFNIFVATFYLL